MFVKYVRFALSAPMLLLIQLVKCYIANSGSPVKFVEQADTVLLLRVIPRQITTTRHHCNDMLSQEKMLPYQYWEIMFSHPIMHSKLGIVQNFPTYGQEKFHITMTNSCKCDSHYFMNGLSKDSKPVCCLGQSYRWMI